MDSLKVNDDDAGEPNEKRAQVKLDVPEVITIERRMSDASQTSF